MPNSAYNITLIENIEKEKKYYRKSQWIFEISKMCEANSKWCDMLV